MTFKVYIKKRISTFWRKENYEHATAIVPRKAGERYKLQEDVVNKQNKNKLGYISHFVSLNIVIKKKVEIYFSLPPLLQQRLSAWYGTLGSFKYAFMPHY